MRTALALALAALAATLACSKKEEGPSPTGSPSATAATAAPALNAAVVENVKAHAEKCTVSVEQGQAYSCKDKITDEMSKIVREQKPADWVSTMIALVRKTDEPKVSAAAVALLNEQFDNLGPEGKKKNASPEVTKNALAMLKENTGNRATRLAPAVTQLATISEAFDELYAALDAHPTKDARDNGYRNLMVFGRTRTLTKLKDVAEKKPEHAAAALDAVPRLGTATDAEKAAACPWAKSFLSNADANVANEAAEDMVFCKGEFIDALLGEAETRLKNKQYKNPFAMTMREPCFEFIKDITKKAGEDKQCDAVYAFLEKAANDSGTDDVTRGMALWNIYYQRRDMTTLKLMRKYEKHPNKEVSKRAKEAIESLTTSYKLKG